MKEQKAVAEEPPIDVQKTEKKQKVKKTNHQKRKSSFWGWPIKILIITLVLSLSITVFSEMILSKTGIIVAICVLIPLLFLAVITDMIGVAVSSADVEPFTSMAARKVRGAKESIFLIKKAEKVSSLLNDVVGDVCGIISGAVGASIVAKIAISTNGDAKAILISASISALIAGLTVFGKAIGKKYAINSSTKIVHRVGKFLSFFTKKIK